jgi:methylmalonyl-CoA mutase
MSYKSEKKLFTEFPPSSPEQWEELIRKDLKGADYEKKLIWKSLEGIPVRPFYTSEDLKELDHLKSLPGEYPYVRGKKTLSGDWLVRQDIQVDDVASANSKAIDALMNGAGSIGFVLDESMNYTQNEVTLLLKDICLASAEINFCTPNPPPGLPGLLINENASRGGTLSQLHGSIEYDPLGILLTTGNYPGGDGNKSLDLATTLINNSGRLPNFSVLNVNASVFHNAGGSAVHELAFAMASAAGYLERLTQAGISAAAASEKIRFTFAAGSNYFMEIAKLRAARYLWTRLLEAWDVDSRSAGKMFIHSVSSGWNKTVYDPYVNMLRSTTEAMSAILGGADSLSVDPFDKAFKKESTAFSGRIARNTQLVLKEEAYFDKVVDPAAGSYYIESLTGSLIEESWRLFLEIDEAGGIQEAFIKGIIQDKLEETAGKRDHFIAGRRDILLGTNQYPDPSERVTGNIDPLVAWPERFAAENPLARPLILYRGARAFEQMRVKTENFAGGPPKVFLLTFGNPAMRKARASFSAGFFGCAGFEIIDNAGFGDPAHGVRAALESKASIVVVCSSDEEYPQIVPFVAGKLEGKAVTVVAGYPKECLQELRDAGVKHFIHIRSNVLETLQEFQNELGIL